jgi:hypothetical protein
LAAVGVWAGVAVFEREQPAVTSSVADVRARQRNRFEVVIGGVPFLRLVGSEALG